MFTKVVTKSKDVVWLWIEQPVLTREDIRKAQTERVDRKLDALLERRGL